MNMSEDQETIDEDVVKSVQENYKKTRLRQRYDNDETLNENLNVLNLPDVPTNYNVPIHVDKIQKQDGKPIETSKYDLELIKDTIEAIQKYCQNIRRKIASENLDCKKRCKYYDEIYLKQMMKIDVLEIDDAETKLTKGLLVKDIQYYMKELQDKFERSVAREANSVEVNGLDGKDPTNDSLDGTQLQNRINVSNSITDKSDVLDNENTSTSTVNKSDLSENLKDINAEVDNPDNIDSNENRGIDQIVCDKCMEKIPAGTYNLVKKMVNMPNKHNPEKESHNKNIQEDNAEKNSNTNLSTTINSGLKDSPEKQQVNIDVAETVNKTDDTKNEKMDNVEEVVENSNGKSENNSVHSNVKANLTNESDDGNKYNQSDYYDKTKTESMPEGKNMAEIRTLIGESNIKGVEDASERNAMSSNSSIDKDQSPILGNNDPVSTQISEIEQHTKINADEINGPDNYRTHRENDLQKSGEVKYNIKPRVIGPPLKRDQRNLDLHTEEVEKNQNDAITPTLEQSNDKEGDIDENKAKEDSHGNQNVNEKATGENGKNKVNTNDEDVKSELYQNEIKVNPENGDDVKLSSNNKVTHEQKILEKINEINLDAQIIAKKMTDEPFIEQNGERYKYYDECFKREIRKLNSLENYNALIKHKISISIEYILGFVKNLESKATGSKRFEDKSKTNQIKEKFEKTFSQVLQSKPGIADKFSNNPDKAINRTISNTETKPGTSPKPKILSSNLTENKSDEPGEKAIKENYKSNNHKNNARDSPRAEADVGKLKDGQNSTGISDSEFNKPKSQSVKEKRAMFEMNKK